MAKKLKHNKIKNTAILFELLTRQITADVLAGKKTASVDIVKEFFNEKTELGNENYNASDFFNGRIRNYKLLASIYNLFQSETLNENFNAEEVINSKFTILEHIVNKKISGSSLKNQVIKEYNKTDKDLRLLTYKILVDKFNKKYKNLDESQKDLLKKYINNISNTNYMKDFVINEVKKVKNTLNEHSSLVSDKVTKIKLVEAINQLKNLTKGKVVTEKQVLKLMRYYELVKEIENVHKQK